MECGETDASVGLLNRYGPGDGQFINLQSISNISSSDALQQLGSTI